MPVPRVLQGVSSFAGIERRFSVRFMQSIEERLKLAGLTPGQVEVLTRRFGTMDRSMLDREGHIVDAILASSHASLGLQAYGLFSQLTSVVTPGGFRIEANAERSWTITPPDGEPFALQDTAGASCVLADGTKVQVERAGLLRAASHALGMQTAENVAKIGVSVLLITTYCLANVAVVGGQSGLRAMSPVLAAASAPGLRDALAAGLEHAGLPEAAAGLRAGAKSLDELGGLPDSPGAAAVVLGCLAAISVAQLARDEVRSVRELLDSAGQSAVPSRRADADAERALIMLRAAELAPRLFAPGTRGPALAEMTAAAKAVRGAAREVVIKAIEEVGGALLGPR